MGVSIKKNKKKSLNLPQLINFSTRPNTENPSKSSLLELILTNAPHRYTDTGVFANDLRDHCTNAAIRSSKLQQTRPNNICKRDIFASQLLCSAIYDLVSVEWSMAALFDDVELALGYFYNKFRCTVNKKAPSQKVRVKGRNNPRFSSEIEKLLKERDIAWAKKTKTEADWLKFRPVRKKVYFISRVKNWRFT